MNLVTVSSESIRVGQPLLFSLRDAQGNLLAQKGYIIPTRDDLNAMIGRGVALYIDVADSEAHHRAYVGKLYGLVRDETSLGQIAGATISTDLNSNRANLDDDEPPDWLDIQVQANRLLKDTQSPQFLFRIEQLQSRLNRYSLRSPDSTLLALFYLSSSELRMYSATHAMLVCVVCNLAAREVLNWPEEQQATLSRAALTMNISMAELQDRLAQQAEALSPAQRQKIDQHATETIQMLQAMGVTDADWLEAVKDHHTKAPGALASKTPGQRMARLIQRADMFTACLAPRNSRVPTSPAAAMQASYFDENRQVDEAGAALIKAVGIYSPGSFVKLTNNEVAIVIRRGANTTTPRVAVLVNREGVPTVEPMIRDTSQREYRIVSSVPYRDMKVKINLQRLLALSAANTQDRIW